MDGATEGADFAVYCAVELFAEGTMRALFSLLFGAGVVILSGGARAQAGGVYYRRQLLLLAFGLFDAFVLLWTGDILVLYALAGMGVVLGARLVAEAALRSGGSAVRLLAGCSTPRCSRGSPWRRNSRARPKRASTPPGRGAADADRALVAEWADLKAQFHPPPEALAREALKFQGAYGEAFLANAVEVLRLYAVAYPLFLYWDALACMVLGMALYKTGVLSGARGARFFGVLAAVGFCVGLAVNGFELAMKPAADSRCAGCPASRWSATTSDAWRRRSASCRWWRSRVRAGGLRARGGRWRRWGAWRLPTTFCKACSGCSCSTRWALACGARWRATSCIWWCSPSGSSWPCSACGGSGRFRFGPMEWLWRALTYRRLPPMRSS